MPAKKKKKTPKPTQEELDDERLREIEGKIKEVLELMGGREDRDSATERLDEARGRHAENEHSKERAFHPTGGGKHVPMGKGTKSALDLAEALRLRIKLGEYALDLGDSLERLAEEHVEVLERSLKRARY